MPMLALRRASRPPWARRQQKATATWGPAFTTRRTSFAFWAASTRPVLGERAERIVCLWQCTPCSNPKHASSNQVFTTMRFCCCLFFFWFSFFSFSFFFFFFFVFFFFFFFFVFFFYFLVPT